MARTTDKKKKQGGRFSMRIQASHLANSPEAKNAPWRTGELTAFLVIAGVIAAVAGYFFLTEDGSGSLTRRSGTNRSVG